MDKVNVTINGKQIAVPKGTTVLEAAKELNITIPTLCYLKDISSLACCRMCLVDVKKEKNLVAACKYPVKEGMEVQTHSEKVMKARKATLELILSTHEANCRECKRGWMNCELQALANKLGIDTDKYAGSENKELDIDKGVSIVRDNNKCILCRRCVSACQDIQTVSVIETINRGFNTVIGSPFEMKLGDTPCVNCGQCINVCPVAAISENDQTQEVWDMINDPDLHVVVQTAPAVRAALGEEFGMPIGTPVTGKMATALKLLGFDKTFDTDTAADLTIMEEGTELLHRIQNGGTLPLITSCSPGWIKFCEHNFPDMLDNLSSCKSPHTMFGAVIKSYYAQKEGIDPKKIRVISIMPCTAKKFECARPEMEVDGLRDVDVVLTTRELAKMIKEKGIDFENLEDSDFEDPFGNASGAGVIFGTTGGVMEAALRTVYEIITGEVTDDIEYKAVRGLEGIKIASVKIGDLEVKAAVAHGLGNARKLLDAVRNGEQELHFIEIMACPGGCINGGGQPIQPSSIRNWEDIRVLRAKALYDEDESLPIRKSHNNESVKKLCEEFLGGEYGGEKSHHLLHTTYNARPNYK